MKNYFILIFLLIIVTGCNPGKNISKEEYAVLNRAVNHILQPYGMTITTSAELDHIAKNNNVDLSNIPHKDAETMSKSINESKGYEFMISDTLFDVSATSGKYEWHEKIDSIKPVMEKIPSAVMTPGNIKFIDGYTRITKKSEQKGEFIGKIKVGRVIFDESGKKALVDYTKCNNIDGTDCNYHIIRLRKIDDEWIVRN